MDAMTLAQISEQICIWPCKLTVAKDVIIVIVGVIYLFERLKAYISNK